MIVKIDREAASRFFPSVEYQDSYKFYSAQMFFGVRYYLSLLPRSSPAQISYVLSQLVGNYESMLKVNCI